MTKSAEDIEKFVRIAEEMLDKGEIDTCINRLYIASENIAMIILQKFSVQFPKRHDKIANAIENIFKTGKISRDFSGTMRRLYELHLVSDYGKEGKLPDKEELHTIVADIKEFLNLTL